jgi:hypothetical protein
VRLEPVRFDHQLLDGSWWPSSADLDAELRTLLPDLNRLCGPVTRLLLSAASWTTRPHQVISDGRVVSIGYLAGQSPAMMTVLCTGGDTFSIRVAPVPAASTE